MNKVKLALVSTLLVVLSACGSSSSGGDEVTELRYQGNVGSVTLAELAENLGYFGKIKEIIARRGRNEDSSAIGYWKSYGVDAKGGVIADNDFQRWIDWLEREGEIKPGQVKLTDVFTNEFNPYANGSAS